MHAWTRTPCTKQHNDGFPIGHSLPRLAVRVARRWPAGLRYPWRWCSSVNTTRRPLQPQGSYRYRWHRLHDAVKIPLYCCQPGLLYWEREQSTFHSPTRTHAHWLLMTALQSRFVRPADRQSALQTRTPITLNNDVTVIIVLPQLLSSYVLCSWLVHYNCLWYGIAHFVLAFV